MVICGVHKLRQYEGGLTYFSDTTFMSGDFYYNMQSAGRLVQVLKYTQRVEEEEEERKIVSWEDVQRI